MLRWVASPLKRLRSTKCMHCYLYDYFKKKKTKEQNNLQHFKFIRISFTEKFAFFMRTSLTSLVPTGYILCASNCNYCALKM